ncbi:nucleoside phosphorylase [Halalkalibacter sp. APA_J-10(15)]|uniref:nucleoside phosphorylase n=1 Tax=Halalkalibacter sp. APA_J-10(15) TaxID=2933805 RepID=UPI001FF21AD1|nr:nucleoside phosphorylase [Halalkalibacter sp. APA_J-10(15)]MCK0472008.1 nucleoside phosphorylase [Halalkalibacter sp. APA_J-10(15)]
MLANLKIDPKKLPEKILVCGDPNRAEVIASYLENACVLAKNREYHSYLGTYHGENIAIVSHGVGGPGAAVCFEELIIGGAQTMIRVGTAGSYRKEIEAGSIVISTAAVRCDGLSNQLVPSGFPAVANREIIQALSTAAANQKETIATFEGMTLTLDAFYLGSVPFPHEIYKQSNVLAVEMENAALFTIASLRGIRAGAIVAIDGYADDNLRENYNPNRESVSRAIHLEATIALDAISTL